MGDWLSIPFANKNLRQKIQKELNKEAYKNLKLTEYNLAINYLNKKS